MSAVVLRYYQQHAIERFIASLKAGRRRVLLVSPTGSGKGTIAAHLLTQTWRQARRGLFIVHRIELARDMVKRVLGMGCTSVGVIVADNVVYDDDGKTVLARNDPHAVIQIATTDTLRARQLPPADLIVQDEAHRSVNKSTITIHQAYPNAKICGLTASPIRLDRRGLDEAFEELIVVATPSELIAAGHIVQSRVFTVPADQLPDLSDVKTSDGDYNQKQLAKAVTRKVLVGYIVDHWRRRAEGLKTMVFAASVEHSKMIVAEFAEAGIVARHVDGKTPKAERAAIIADHKARVFPVLVQCNLLVEGYDDPEIECVVLARPTKSLTIYLQAVGRLSRPCGNKQVIVLDHAGNANVHGLPEADREWTLEGPPKRKPKEGAEVAARTCPMCYMVVPAATAICPACGHEFAPDLRRPPQTVEGELVELKADPLLERQAFWSMAWGRSYREGHPVSWVYGRYREKFHEEPPADWVPAPRPDANFTQEQKDAELRKLRAAASRNKFGPGWVAERYEARFGEPPRAMNAAVREITTTQTPPVTAAEEAAAAEPDGETVYEEMF